MSAVWFGDSCLTSDISLEESCIASLVLEGLQVTALTLESEGKVVPPSSPYLTYEAHRYGVRTTLIGYFDHWSRVWEYPWVSLLGKFGLNQKVLDVGGANSILPYRIAHLGAEVTTLDINPLEPQRREGCRLHQRYKDKVEFVLGDARKTPFPNNSYDKVVCVSALEHMTNPLQAIEEMWRVLKPGGRLLATMDVADYSRHNHSVDIHVAAKLLDFLEIELPKCGLVNTSKYKEELPLGEGDKEEYQIIVLGFYADKPL